MKKLFAMTALAAIALTGAALQTRSKASGRHSRARLHRFRRAASFCVKLTTGQHAGKRSTR